MSKDFFSRRWHKDVDLHPDVFKILPTPGIVLALDFPVLTILYANEAFEALVSVPESNLIGKGFFDLFSNKMGVDTSEWADLFEKAVANNVIVKLPVFKFNKKSIDGEGAANAVHFVGSAAQVAGLSQFVCSFTDVTEVISGAEYEKDIATDRNSKLLEETQRIARIGSWEANLTTSTIIWSDFTKEIYEVGFDFAPSFDDVIGFIKIEQERQAFTSLVENAMVNGNMFDADLQITTAAGNERTIRISGQAAYEDGHCHKIYGAVQDITEKTKAEHFLKASRGHLESLVQSVNGIFWEADALAFEFSFVSDHVTNILGYSPEEWLEERNFWENHIHPDDVQNAVSYCQNQVKNQKDHTLDYRMIRADGNVIWIKDIVSVIVENGRPTFLRGLMLDITETKRLEELSLLEKAVLELHITNDATLRDLLMMYLRGIETIYPGMKCSLHEVKENLLELAFAPSISSDYLKLLHKLPIGPDVGSCGTAAYLKQRVIVADIASDPRWAGYAEAALKYNLLACWSQPIVNSEGEVIATLGFYYNKTKSPDEGELSLLERCAAILRVILENRQKSILLEESSLLMKQGQGLAGFGNWQWDILNDIVQWSDELYAIYGLDKTAFKATFDGYQELLHPDDRERVKNIILEVVHNKTDIVFEERIVRPHGEIRYLKSWGRLQTDEKGVPVKMIGACLDITESRRYVKAINQQNEKLQDIAFVQSHVVRAPLARLMGAVDLLKNYPNSEQENRQFLDYILASAQELEGIIRDISQKAS